MLSPLFQRYRLAVELRVYPACSQAADWLEVVERLELSFVPL
jgi:hypothetical protein